MFSALGNRFPARGVSPIGFSAETCQSGRMGHPAKVLSAQVDRGFKSHRLRQLRMTGSERVRFLRFRTDVADTVGLCQTEPVVSI